MIYGFRDSDVDRFVFQDDFDLKAVCAKFDRVCFVSCRCKGLDDPRMSETF
jgi:hypothetical protein